MCIKKFCLLVVQAMLILLIVNGNVFATLHDRGGGLIYDDVLNITWLQDANYYWTSECNPSDPYYCGMKDYVDAAPWVDNLVYHDSVRSVDHTGWRLPTTEGEGGPGRTGGELGHLYYITLGNPVGSPRTNSGPFIRVLDEHYWSSVKANEWGTFMWAFGFDSGYENAHVSESYHVAIWPVMDGDVGLTPDPVPTVSEWGLIIMIGIFLTLGAIIIRKQHNRSKINNTLAIK